MTYFVKEKLNRAGQVISMTQIQYSKNKISAKSNKIEIDMNGTKFKDYQESPNDYYLSGKRLMKVEKESDTNE